MIASVNPVVAQEIFPSIALLISADLLLSVKPIPLAPAIAMILPIPMSVEEATLLVVVVPPTIQFIADVLFNPAPPASVVHAMIKAPVSEIVAALPTTAVVHAVSQPTPNLKITSALLKPQL